MMTKNSPKTKPIMVSERDLARLLCTTLTEVRLRTSNAFFHQSKGKYDLKKSAVAYASERRNIAAGRKSAEVDENGHALDPVEMAARLKISQADAVEMQLAVAEGKLVAMETVRNVIGTLILQAKLRLESLPHRIKRSAVYNMRNDTTAELTAAIRRCLNRLVKDGAEAKRG